MSFIIGDEKYSFCFNDTLEVDFTWTAYYLDKSFIFEKNEKYVLVDFPDPDLKVTQNMGHIICCVMTHIAVMNHKYDS